METRQELKRRLERFEGIEFAYLFGSRANASARSSSDWDVAIYLSETSSADDRFQLIRRLASELDDLGTVDLVVLNEAPALLGHRALMGEPLFVRNKTAFVRYFVKTLAESEDERYFREIHADARRKRLEEGRFGRP